MTDEAIEAAARAMCENDSWRTWKGDEAFVQMARAAAPALMEEGARLALEAAARIVNGWRECDWPEGYHPHAINEICEDRAMRVRALNPANIVKGAGHG